ncbi:MAG: hypothetical protein QOI20_1310 [Acidimicrobiaceae bacterium]|nr:hypothetical protein [Acidimicrobiaceae bacterium]
MQDISRRHFLAGLGGLVGVQLVGPAVLRTGRALASFVDPAASARHRIVVISLFGGNDGLNTVVPMADVGGANRRSVYEKVRPTLAYPTSVLLPLDRPGDADQALGLNPKLTTLHGLYESGQVAIVQGVDYPNHNYSHFTSSDIWQSGQPDRAPDSGWLGRHIDRVGIADGEVRALAFGTDLPLLLTGERETGALVTGIAETRFTDGTDPYADVRHQALARFAGSNAGEPLRRAAGAVARSTVGLVDDFEATPVPPGGPTNLSRMLMNARVLFEQGLGLEVVFVEHAGFDTHNAQKKYHEPLLDDLDASIGAFFTGAYRGQDLGIGPMSADDAAKTLVLVYSEFGRRIGENGAGTVTGTDHGAAGPVFLIGPSVAGGLKGDHPALGSPLAPADNVQMTTDVRSVYASVLRDWLGDPDPRYDAVTPLAGLFTPTA